MSEVAKTQHPWLLAVWPGMGGVAITAGYYLMAKLGMHRLMEFPAAEYFENHQVDIKDGLIITPRLPRSRLFQWTDPAGMRDLIVFIGEAQPPTRGTDFCRHLIQAAKQLRVERVFTFAAMATQMQPCQPSRVFSAAIDRATLSEFRQLDMEILKSGQISGLNGLLLGVAAAEGLPGGCMLGEIPQIFPHIPFPKAAHAVLEHFSAMAKIKLDLQELQEHGRNVEHTLMEFLSRVEMHKESEGFPAEPENVKSQDIVLKADQQARIDALFEAAASDRSRAYELKQELDHLGVFHQFEDRFLDLFKDSD